MGADLLENRRFESISLQRGVTCEPDLVLVIGTVGIFASSARLRRSLEQRSSVTGYSVR
jgi:hypothetical protein